MYVFGDSILDIRRPTKGFRVREKAVSTLDGDGVPWSSFIYSIPPLNQYALRIISEDSTNLIFKVTRFVGYKLVSSRIGGESRSAGTIWVIRMPNAIISFLREIQSHTRTHYELCVFVDADTTVANEVVFNVFRSFKWLSGLSQILPSNTSTNVMNLSARAWDVRSDQTINYILTHKVDGERTLVFVIYPMVFRTRRNPHLSILSVSVLPQLKQFESYNLVCFDTEYECSSGFVLLDVLITSDGTYAPVQRGLGWVSDEAAKFVHLFPYLDIIIRDYWTHVPGVKAKPTTLINDGLVAIHPSNVAAMKLKDVFSIELMLNGNKLLTADGHTVATMTNNYNGFMDGDVIEIKFSSLSHGKINVTEMFRRLDKTKANSLNAVVNILTISLSSGNREDENERRRALLWCNNVTRHINSHVESMDTSKVLIIDVGSGDGQSLDMMSIHDHRFSRLFVEPDTKKFVKLCKRLKVNCPAPGHGHIRSLLKAIVLRRCSIVVCNETFGDLCKDTNLAPELFAITRAIVGTYSLHFVIPDLHRVTIEHKIPIYGCVYVYDDIDKDGVLVDACGVTMSRSDTISCCVKWGRDTVYHEPLTITSDYMTFGRVSLPWQVSSAMILGVGEYTKICKHVRMIGL